MVADRASDHGVEGPAPIGQWPPGCLRDAGDRERDSLPGPDRLPVGLLPHDLPPKSATYCYHAAWRDGETDQVIHELLRCQVRERARPLEDPTLVVLDTQSVFMRLLGSLLPRPVWTRRNGCRSASGSWLWTCCWSSPSPSSATSNTGRPPLPPASTGACPMPWPAGSPTNHDRQTHDRGSLGMAGPGEAGPAILKDPAVWVGSAYGTERWPRGWSPVRVSPSAPARVLCRARRVAGSRTGTRSGSPAAARYRPIRLEFSAHGNKGFSLTGWLDNPAAGVRTP